MEQPEAGASRTAPRPSLEGKSGSQRPRSRGARTAPALMIADYCCWAARLRIADADGHGADSAIAIAPAVATRAPGKQLPDRPRQRTGTTRYHTLSSPNTRTSRPTRPLATLPAPQA